MFWIELLIAFLAVYINFAGAVIILHALRRLYDVIRLHSLNTPNSLAPTIWALVGVMFFVLTVPLELTLAGSIGLNPIMIAGAILIALIIKKSGLADVRII